MTIIFVLSSLSFLQSCKGTIGLGEKSPREKNFKIDSFQVSLPLYEFTNSLLSEKIDCLLTIVDKFPELRNEVPDYPFYIVITPLFEDNSPCFVLSAKKGYTLDFRPPDEDNPSVIDKGFGVIIYKGILVKLNGSLKHFIYENETGGKSLVHSTKKVLNFYAFGEKHRKDGYWSSGFYPYMRDYYILKEGHLVYLKSEIDKVGGFKFGTAK
ncbi:MAG: hypothetical protein KDC85_18595 [Saprospiraceae bacterium]|nr:hypothetical protein [Saprospiraceae bacterium]MCB9322394.1 hypothetical protein [Lewinellaceae bacterium]